jgi:polyphenol oxidase
VKRPCHLGNDQRAGGSLTGLEYQTENFPIEHATFSIFLSFRNSMERIKINNLHLWQFDNLRGGGIHHFVTDRSSSGGKEFTLSYSSHPDRKFVDSNRRELAEAMGVEPSQLFFPSQVHETRILHVRSDTPRKELMNTDALVTDERGVCIAVMSADCVPILLYDKRHEVVAAVHSGWRGTVARILEKTLHHLREQFGTQGVDLLAGIGPSVSQDSYEVGEEVIHNVKKNFTDSASLLIEQPQNKAMLDLWKANKIQLLEFGVPETQIEISDLCTVKNNEHFFSARKGDAGRFAAGIMLAK